MKKKLFKILFIIIFILSGCKTGVIQLSSSNNTGQETYSFTTSISTTAASSTPTQSDKIKRKNFSAITKYGNNIYALFDSGLYKISLIDKTIKCISTDPLITYNEFCAYEEWVFFSKGGDNSGIYRVRDDGKPPIKICNDFAYDLRVFNGKLYYYLYGNYHGIVCLNIDGSDRVKLTEFAESIYTTEDWIYFTAGKPPYRSIQRIKYDGTTSNFSVKLSDLQDLYVNDGWIYYKERLFLEEDMGYLYKVRTDGTDKQLVLEERLTYYVGVDDNWIYLKKYISEADNEKTIMYGKLSKDLSSYYPIYIDKNFTVLDDLIVVKENDNMIISKLDGTELFKIDYPRID